MVETETDVGRSGRIGASSTYSSTNTHSQQNLTQTMDVNFSSSGWLPVLLGIFLGLSMIVPYCIAVSLGHVNPIFPYISDSGNIPPESCIFGQLLNLAAFFAFITVFVRYRQVKDYYQVVEGKVLHWSTAAVVSGCLAALGMSVVANFQSQSVLSTVHSIGGVFCFGGGCVYEFIQSWISYKLTPQHCSLLTCRLRLSLSVFTTLLFGMTLLFQQLSVPRPWLPTDVTFALRIVSTTSEWANALCYIFFFLTFFPEFRKMGTDIEQRQGYAPLA